MPCPLQLQHAAVPVLLGRNCERQNGSGETLPGTEACRNRVRAAGGGRRHWILDCNIAKTIGMDARQERVQRSKNPRLRADGKDRPDPLHAGAVWYFCCDQMGDVLVAEFVESDGNAALVPPSLVQMGDEEYIVSLRESDDRCRSPGNQHLSHGRL